MMTVEFSTGQEMVQRQRFDMRLREMRERVVPVSRITQWMLRHGQQADMDKDSDAELTPAGRLRVELFGIEFAESLIYVPRDQNKIILLFHSDKRRTKETAEIIERAIMHQVEYQAGIGTPIKNVALFPKSEMDFLGADNTLGPIIHGNIAPRDQANTTWLDVNRREELKALGIRTPDEIYEKVIKQEMFERCKLASPDIRGFDIDIIYATHETHVGAARDHLYPRTDRTIQHSEMMRMSSTADPHVVECEFRGQILYVPH